MARWSGRIPGGGIQGAGQAAAGGHGAPPCLTHAEAGTGVGTSSARHGIRQHVAGTRCQGDITALRLPFAHTFVTRI